MNQSSPLDDGEIGDDDSRDFDDGYDENLMGDEEDRMRLAQMTEMEREQELFNRGERRENLRIRFETERKLKAAKKRENAEPVKRQKAKQVRATKRLKASDIYSSDDSSEESDEYQPDNKSGILNDLNNGNKSRMNTRSALRISSSSEESSSSSSPSSSSESEPELDGFEEDDNRRDPDDDFQMTLAELKALQLKREQIEEWVYAPFFKDTVIGLFVKISVGNHPNTKLHMYKVAQIIDIKQCPSIYALNNGKNKTDKSCLVRIGQVDRTFKMSFVSNRSFDEEDFMKWRDQLAVDDSNTPTREYYEKKRRDLERAKNYVYEKDDIAYVINEKSRFKDAPYNFALRKTELMGEKAEAEAQDDYEKARRLQQEIDELEEKASRLEKSRSSSTFSAITIVNERNRKKNIIESERVLKESKSVKTEDPFTRRKCNPTIVHNKNSGDVDDSTKQQQDKNGLDSSSAVADTNATNASSTNGSKPNFAKPEAVKSADDLFQAHASIDLELDI